MIYVLLCSFLFAFGVYLSIEVRRDKKLPFPLLLVYVLVGVFLVILAFMYASQGGTIKLFVPIACIAGYSMGYIMAAIIYGVSTKRCNLWTLLVSLGSSIFLLFCYIVYLSLINFKI